MNIQETIINAAKLLNNEDIKTPMLDSELLLSKILNKNKKYIILNSKEIISKKNIINFYNLVSRRRKGEPVAYLTNFKEFWKQKYFVHQMLW